MTLKRIYTISLTVFVLIASTASAQKRDAVVNYINQYKQLAMEEMQRTGVPAALKLAQGIHETDAGTSVLVNKSNNHFGIKCKSTWTGAKVYHDDDARGECFRSYGKAEDSYRDHSNFLKNSPRYAFLFDLDPTDYKGWAMGLKRAGYATNVRYSQVLIKIIEDYNLEQYTLIAMGKLKPEEEVVATVNNTPPPSTAIMNEPTVAKPEVPAVPARNYPQGVFTINETKVMFAKGGVSLLAIAEQHNLTLARLLDFNDMAEDEGDILEQDQLLYLQRKRRVGANSTHVIAQGELLYDVAQSEGIRLDALLELNHLKNGMEPAVGEKVYLQQPAPARPALYTERPITNNKINASVPVYNNNTSYNNVNEQTPVIAKAVLPRPANGTIHVVQTKETLYGISKKYGVTTEQLKEWNNLGGLDIKIGQELLILKN